MYCTAPLGNQNHADMYAPGHAFQTNLCILRIDSHSRCKVIQTMPMHLGLSAEFIEHVLFLLYVVQRHVSWLLKGKPPSTKPALRRLSGFAECKVEWPISEPRQGPICDKRSWADILRQTRLLQKSHVFGKVILS
jgi:hypothetical protein